MYKALQACVLVVFDRRRLCAHLSLIMVFSILTPFLTTESYLARKLGSFVLPSFVALWLLCQAKDLMAKATMPDSSARYENPSAAPSRPEGPAGRPLPVVAFV